MSRFVYLVIAALTLAGCSDSTGPVSAAGRYELVSVGGESLPGRTRPRSESICWVPSAD